MQYLCTTCCRDKLRDDGLLPAAERYADERIARVLAEARRRGVPMLFLSGRFGLLAPHDLIPYYDHALCEEEVVALVPRLVRALQERGVSELRFLALPRDTPGWEPYYAALEAACAQAGIRWQVELIGERGSSAGCAIAD